jgi:cardiolipin synthase
VIDAIRGAQKFIHLSTFIIADGVFLRTLFTELIKKAQEGVKIRFLYDWLGSAFRYHKRDLKQLRAAGIEVGIFNPKGINVFKGSSNYRMHHKSLIVDNKLALYGGSNFGDDYLSMNAKCHH